MPSEPSEYTPKSSSPDQELIVSSASDQHGHSYENNPASNARLEREHFGQNEPEGSNRSRDLDAPVVSATERSKTKKPAGLGQVSDDSSEKPLEVRGYFTPSGTVIKSIPTLVKERPTKLPNSTQIGGIEKLPNGKTSDLF